MLELVDASFSYGGQTIFEDVNLFVGNRERIGLIGLNGAGKSTLFKIILGELSLEDGNLQIQKGVQAAQLDQDIELPLKIKVIDYVKTAFEKAHAYQQELAKIQHQLENDTSLDEKSLMDLVERLQVLEDYLMHHDADKLEGQIETVLKGLGFDRSWFDRTIETFSGGWRMRIELARLLLLQPEVLMLDEPTNHLDIESILWLEEWLKSYEGTVVLISHDQKFLNQTANRIWDLRAQGVFDYKGPYHKYLVDKVELEAKLKATFENQQKKIKEMQRTADRFRAKASKSKMAQSMDKMIAKESDALVEPLSLPQRKMNIVWPSFHPGGKVMLEVKGLQHQYDDGPVVLDHVDLTVERGQRIAFVGKNGEGKSTLGKLIAKELTPIAGEVNWGYNADLYYFDQYQAEILDGSLTVLETLERNGPNLNTTQIRSLLGAFMFSGEEVEKKVKVLSGGEKNRLALAKMIMNGPNFLILDEPTNHLDVETRQVLKDALKQYEGTLIVISHDRTFLEDLCPVTYYFENAQIQSYLGDINYVLEKRGIDNMRSLERKQKVKEGGTKAKAGDSDYEFNKKLGKIERQIERLEKEKADLECTLADPDVIADKMLHAKHVDNYRDIDGKLKKKLEAWEALIS